MVPMVVGLIWGRVARSGLLRYVAGAILILLVLFGLYRWGYHSGESDVRAEYEEAIEAERQRQLEIQREAERDAARRIEELEAVIAARDTQLERLRNEAARDPSAAGRAIGADSVRRLNTID